MSQERRWPQRWLLLWTALAGGLTAVGALSILDQPYVEPNGWVAAHFAIMGRVFAEAGAWAQGWIPIQSNPPQGTAPEIYIHWPPLFSVLLGWVYQLFGVSEATGRLLMLGLLATNTTLVGLLARAAGSLRAGLFAAISFLSLPIILNEGLLVLHLHLAIAGALAALWCFGRATRDFTRQDRRGDVDETASIAPLDRRWATAGVVSLGLGLWASWEPALLCPGLLAATAWQAHARSAPGRPWLAPSTWSVAWRDPALRLAFTYCTLGVVAVVTVIMTYALQTPSMLEDLAQVARFRAGAAPTYLETGGASQPSLPRLLFRYQERLELLSPLALVAIGVVLTMGIIRWHASRSSRATPIVLALASFWVLWFTLMRGHAFFHDYQMLLGAPLAAVALGVMADGLATRMLPAARGVTERRALVGALFVVLPLVVLKPLVVTTYLRATVEVGDTAEIVHARAVRDATPEGSVVLSPYGGMVVSYYTERRTLRGVLNDARVEEVMSTMGPTFPDGTPFFLAIVPELEPAFAETLTSNGAVERSEILVLVKILPTFGRDPQPAARAIASAPHL